MPSFPESIPLFAVYAGGTSFLLALLLVCTKHWHGQVTMDSCVGVQKAHLAPTPRVGGIAILVGILVGYQFFEAEGQTLLWPLIVAGIPAFAFGLLEDLTKQVGVRTRLLATMACGVLGWAITGESITSIDVPGVDWILGFTVISVAFTAFAVGGVANAINIIDGFNGLAAGTVIIILTAFGLIATSLGDADLALTCLIVAGAVMGFALVNWPFGKLFLGDGGAYFIGFALAWLSVLLTARHPEVSPWAPVLVCGYPILEVLFSIVRRRRRNISPGAPDRLHLHSLVKRRLVRRLLSQASNLVLNSVTGAIMWGAAFLPAAVAVLWYDNAAILVTALLSLAGLYSVGYDRLTRFQWIARPSARQSTRRHTPAKEMLMAAQRMKGMVLSRGDRPRMAILGTRGIPAAYGGFETFAEELAIRLVKSGIDVTVYCEAGAGPQETVYNGIRLVYLPATRCGPLTTVLFDVRSVWQARKGFDVVYMLGYGAAPACFIPRLWGARVWINVDGIEWARAKWNPIAKLYFRAMEWFATWIPNRIIADADGIRTHLCSRHQFKTPCSVIAYGANPVEHVPDARLIEEFQLNTNKYFLVVSRIEPENHVLEIINGYLESDSHIPLVVIGNHRAQTPYARRVSAHTDVGVRFLGAIYDKAKLQALRYHALAYCHGHSVGGTNPSLLEALACGNLVIAHDNVFNREVAGGVSQFFETASELPTMFRQVEAMDVSARLKLQRLAVQRINEVYSWERIAERYLSLISSDIRRLVPLPTGPSTVEDLRAAGLQVEDRPATPTMSSLDSVIQIDGPVTVSESLALRNKRC